jgi:predicted AAA+ superfamily ATPase
LQIFPDYNKILKNSSLKASTRTWATISVSREGRIAENFLTQKKYLTTFELYWGTY